MLHIYHGDGKGKTTAAMGLALRALGAGKRVFIVQFLKGWPTGEVKALLANPAVTILRGKPGMKFVSQMSAEEKEEVCALHRRQLQLAFQAIAEVRAEILVLDEALDAINTGTLSEDALLHALRRCPEEAEVIITGREPSEALIQRADYVTRMKKRKASF